MNADGSNPQNLTGSHRDNWAPSWSPNGKRIAFTSAPKGDEMEIYVMNADGSNPQNLTNSPFPDESHPAWFHSGFAVDPAGKQFTMWGWLKQVVR